MKVINMNKVWSMRDLPLSMRNEGVTLCMTRVANTFLDISYVETPARLVVCVPKKSEDVKDSRNGNL